MPRFNPDLRRVRVEPTAQPHRIRLFVTVHACVLIFCKTMRQEQLVTVTRKAHGGLISAQLVPHGGDFRGGQASWRVHPCTTVNAPSCLEVRIELQPAFWVPPLIGPWILQRKLYTEARRSSRGIELMAAEIAASERRGSAVAPAPSPRLPHRPKAIIAPPQSRATPAPTAVPITRCAAANHNRCEARAPSSCASTGVRRADCERSKVVPGSSHSTTTTGVSPYCPRRVVTPGMTRPQQHVAPPPNAVRYAAPIPTATAVQVASTPAPRRHRP